MHCTCLAPVGGFSSQLVLGNKNYGKLYVSGTYAPINNYYYGHLKSLRECKLLLYILFT